MCISYSGRCLLSNYLANRDSNRGACVQACRWQYCITEKNREGEQYEIQEDKRGTYILNSKDLCLIEHLEELKNAGAIAFSDDLRSSTIIILAFGAVGTVLANTLLTKYDSKRKRGDSDE